MSIRLSALVLVSASMLGLCGCAASVRKSDSAAPLAISHVAVKTIVLNVTGSKAIMDSGDWEQFKGEWRAAMKAAAGSIGATVVAQEGEPKATGAPGVLIVVEVADYHYLSPGARYAFGVMTGNAYINSTVQFRDLTTGNLQGERKYDTSSSAWQGIFSAMTEKQVQAICKQIVGELPQ